jgi:hypothetical protein
MIDIADYIYTRVRKALDSISSEERHEIYVVSLFVYDEDDDPRRPTLTVGFNTESNVAAAPGAEDEREARWNYAFYLQNELDVLFDATRDPGGAALLRRAIEDMGYWFPGEDDVATEVTTPWFVANAVFAARRLQDDGDIARIFGRSIPVLVHEVEYYDAIAMQALAANPPGVADEFIAWVRSLA